MKKTVKMKLEKEKKEHEGEREKKNIFLNKKIYKQTKKKMECESDK